MGGATWGLRGETVPASDILAGQGDATAKCPNAKHIEENYLGHPHGCVGRDVRPQRREARLAQATTQFRQLHWMRKDDRANCFLFLAPTPAQTSHTAGNQLSAAAVVDSHVADASLLRLREGVCQPDARRGHREHFVLRVHAKRYRERPFRQA